MTRSTIVKAEVLLKEFEYTPAVNLNGSGDLYVWRVFRVRISLLGSWEAWSTEGDSKRTGGTLAGLKKYLNLMHT